jgi:hypothetical protein
LERHRPFHPSATSASIIGFAVTRVATSWVKAEGAMDIEAILKALIAKGKDNGLKIIEVNAVSVKISIEILDIGSKEAFEAYADGQCKIDGIREQSIRFTPRLMNSVVLKHW